jgi:ribosome-binding protein aMBF1 (putative translation factor)
MRVRKVVRRIAGESAAEGRNPVDVRLGQLMKERRKRVGLSRKGLAAQLDMTKADIRKYETGKIHFGVDMLAVLRVALKISVAHFTDQITALVRSRGVARYDRN